MKKSELDHLSDVQWTKQFWIFEFVLGMIINERVDNVIENLGHFVTKWKKDDRHEYI